MLMIKFTYSLLLIICINNGLFAQQTTTEKKITHNPASSKDGFKKQSPLTTAEKKSTPQNTAPAPVANHTTTTSQNKAQVTAADDAKASEILRVDYNNMPADVQSKINNNKLHGKYLLDGVAKAFLVEINTCLTDADQKKTLSFLKTKKGFINSQLTTAGRVTITVEPTFDSADLKDAMASEGIHFNFLSRSYLLKN
jgi:hypothetical protein